MLLSSNKMSSHDDEKVVESQVDESQPKSVKLSAAEAFNEACINAFTPAEQKKIIHRVDRRLVLTIGFMYCVSLMDRNNLGIASIAGMGSDLALVGSRYSIVVLVFFITYVILQPPATVILRKVGPRVFLPGITLAWGIVMIGFGFARDWVTLIPLRLLLGAIEAGFFPGCAYLLSCWYPRYELQKRNAVFFAIGSMASAFSGILAYGFSQLNGHGSGSGYLGLHFGPTAANPNAPSGIGPGIAGWRWIL
jgi:sugar phosphate permease